MNDPEEGAYLVDANGMSVYQFKADAQGRDGVTPESACNDDACVGTWPPLIVADAPVGDEQIDLEMLGTLRRQDGSLQATYNGWPLYQYYEDAKPGDMLGDEIESFGEDRYLISPLGDRPAREDTRKGGRDRRGSDNHRGD